MPTKLQRYSFYHEGQNIAHVVSAPKCVCRSPLARATTTQSIALLKALSPLMFEDNPSPTYRANGN